MAHGLPGKARRGLGLLLIAAAAPAVAASVRDRVDLLESDVRDLQQRVADGQAADVRLADEIADLRGALGLEGEGGRTPADLAARLDALEEEARVLRENQEQTLQRVAVLTDRIEAVFRSQSRLEQVVAQMASGTAPAGAPGPASPDAAAAPTVAAASGALPPLGELPEPVGDPEEIYQAARADYGRGSFDLAIAGFQDFLRQFPDSELADNAWYWIGDSQQSLGRSQEALDAYTTLVEDHPDSDKVPDARYKRALALLDLNRTADGIMELQAVRDAHPDTTAGRLARQKLQSLGLSFQ